MKNIFIAIAFLFTAFLSAQETNKPTIQKKGDLFEATYFYDNGDVSQKGYFNKDSKLQGVWTKFDQQGNKLAVGEYDNGVKVGKWLFWSNDTLREVDYDNNTIANVNKWELKSTIADRD
jgi:antitoxin component YwqK of YwqJK toxin-antitoxin module